MEKFSNVDILAALDAIMRQNTGFYQDQFQNDRQTITEAAASPAKDDKTLLWVSAPAGTCCETEKDLLIRENVEYGRFRVFAEGVRLDGDKALCYAVKITGAEGGKITGDLYRLDYLEQLARLSDVALPAAYVTFTGKDGAAHRFPYKEYRENEQRIRRRFGPCRSFAYEPKSKVTLARRLRLEQEGREREARPADLQAHVRQLAADKVYTNYQLFKTIATDDTGSLIKSVSDGINIADSFETFHKGVYDTLRNGKSDQKAEFALDLIYAVDPNELIVPAYIDEGLKWLQAYLDPEE